MKRVFLIAMSFLLFGGLLCAQEGRVISFRGIPIDGTLSSFVEKLKSKNFAVSEIGALEKMLYQEKGLTVDGDTVIGKIEGSTTGEKSFVHLYGRFFGCDNCLITVSANEEKNMMVGLSVTFPQQIGNWKELKKRFQNVCGYYTQTYGKPVYVNRKFQYPYSEGDGNEKIAAETGYCDYRNVYNVANGQIIIYITRSSVCVFYVNKTNRSLCMQAY
jgi:hypothetical protein